MQINGFTLLRNGVKYDYPFVQSLHSLGELTDKVYLALGNNVDSTTEQISKFKNLEIINTIWDDSLRTGGEVLSQQTNIALEFLKSNVSDGWGFYLQADEVIGEFDYQKIKEDIELADRQGYDCVSFRYFHFWQSYQQIAITKNWYPTEIRAIKLNTTIKSYGDAQSFKNYKKIYYSDATIFHYGHVREEKKYKLKINDFNKLWHEDIELEKIEKKSIRKIKKLEQLHYLGKHPKIMENRIIRFGSKPVKKSGINILIDKNFQLDKSFLDSIYVDHLLIDNNVDNLNKEFPIISLRNHFFDRLKYGDKVPIKMRSRLASNWPVETILALKLSKKGIWSL